MIGSEHTDPAHSGHIPFTTDAKEMLDRAAGLATAEKHQTVDPYDLLRAAFAIGPIAAALRDCPVDDDLVRTAAAAGFEGFLRDRPPRRRLVHAASRSDWWSGREPSRGPVLVFVPVNRSTTTSAPGRGFTVLVRGLRVARMTMAGAAATAVLLAVASCTAPAAPPSTTPALTTPPPTPPSASPPLATVVPSTVVPSPSTTTLPPKAVEFEDAQPLDEAACSRPGAVYNPTSPPYAGRAPHPIDAFELPVRGRRVQHEDFTGFYGDLTPPRVVADIDRNQVQLLACIQPVLRARAGSVTCTFTQGVARSRTWPLYETDYHVLVREARTGRQVADLVVAGSETPTQSCPGVATDDRDTIVARSLTEAALTAAVRPIVAAPL